MGPPAGWDTHCIVNDTTVRGRGGGSQECIADNKYNRLRKNVCESAACCLPMVRSGVSTIICPCAQHSVIIYLHQPLALPFISKHCLATTAIQEHDLHGKPVYGNDMFKLSLCQKNNFHPWALPLAWSPKSRQHLTHGDNHKKRAKLNKILYVPTTPTTNDTLPAILGIDDVSTATRK